MRNVNLASIALASSLLLMYAPRTHATIAGGDQVVFDFETGNYDGWKRMGNAFGEVAATGTLPHQLPVSGFCGRYLANSFAKGDDATGRMTSESFSITRRYLRFLVGGGDDDHLVVRLEFDGRVEFEATGARSELLRPVCWDLRAFRGRQARLVLIDELAGPWGHLLADQFVLSDDATGAPPVSIGPRRRIFDPRAEESLPYTWNDPCFVRDVDDLWHVFATTSTEPGHPDIDGMLFSHATSRSLTAESWRKEERTLEIDFEAGETRLRAPHIVHQGNTWYLFYHAGGAQEHRSSIHLATSKDLKTWKRDSDNPIVIDGYQARDPFVLREGDEWLMYYSATFPAEGGQHTVAVRSSTDLRKWSEATEAYRDPRIGKDFGPTESPFVVARGEYYYLFLGSSKREEYDTTRVFRSRDPRNWAPSDLVTTLRVHGAEIVRDKSGEWYASHAGNGRGGLWLAPLYWNDTFDDGALRPR